MSGVAILDHQGNKSRDCQRQERREDDRRSGKSRHNSDDTADDRRSKQQQPMVRQPRPGSPNAASEGVTDRSEVCSAQQPHPIVLCSPDHSARFVAVCRRLRQRDVKPYVFHFS
jgi:hypothetical protein